MQKVDGKIEVEQSTEEVLRARLKQCETVVVKVGTNVIVKGAGEIHRRRLHALVRQLAGLAKQGKKVVLVTSGAIGAGLEALNAKRRPRDLTSLQIAAAVGQSRLMGEYARYFAEEGLMVAQVLLTYDDLRNRQRHLNTRGAILGLLERGILPIVNENDVVAVDELKFGDNDVLAALLSSLLPADLLIILSSTNGLRGPGGTGRSERVGFISEINAEVLSWAEGKTSELSTGGMDSKLQSVDIVLKIPAMAVIADGRDPKNLARVIAGADVGTVFGNVKQLGKIDLNSRKRWVSFFHRAKGSIIVDSGAAEAIVKNQVSLLPVGVRGVEGKFGVGDLVSVKDVNGHLIAQGVTSYSSIEIKLIMGKKSSELKAIIGSPFYEEVVHRDNLAVKK